MVESGDDTLIGGNGGETLTGGPGADTFDCGHAKDIVTDYNEAEGDILITCENAIINTPQGPVVITQPDTITDCESDFVVSGTADPGASITLLIEGTETELGTTTADANGDWSITLNPTDPNLGGDSRMTRFRWSLKHRKKEKQMCFQMR